jgi:hypothetical protein
MSELESLCEHEGKMPAAAEAGLILQLLRHG